jgi:CysZ protein
VARLTEGTAVQRFRLGMSFPFRAFRYLREHPPLWGWVALPAAINLALLVVAVASSWMAAPQLVGWLWSRPAEGLALAMWVLTVWVARLALAGVMGMAVYLAAGVFAAPFNEVISERVEELELGAASEPWTVVDFVRDTTVSVFHSLGSLAIYLFCMAPLLLLNLIPGLGSVLFTVASWTLTAFFLAREMLDGATSRRRMSFKAKLELVNRHRPLMGGFGFAQNLLLWIPLANFVCLPIGVIGGTLLYIELERAGLAPSRKRIQRGGDLLSRE